MHRRFIVGTMFFVMIFLIVISYGGARAAVQNRAEIRVVKILYSQNSSKAYIPQISGMINKDLQTVINYSLQEAVLSHANSPESTLHGDAEISFYNGNLLGLHFIGDSFTPGTLHPNKIDCGIHIDLTTGDVYKFADLFAANVNFKKQVHELCANNDGKYRIKIAELWDGWTNQTFTDSWTMEEGSFLLMDDAVRVYTIPSHATGAISGYKVPYADLIDIINTEGKLWRQIQSGESVLIR